MPRAVSIAKRKTHKEMDTIGPKALRLLALTEKSMLEIAKSLGLGNANPVQRINHNYGIRGKGETDAIRSKHISLSKKKLYAREKVKHFTRKQKFGLLEKNKGAIIESSKKWWRSQKIRNYFGNDFNSFQAAIRDYLFSELDYFNPKVKGYKGKAMKPSTWIFEWTRFFCLKLNMGLKKIEPQMLLDRKGLPVSQTALVRTPQAIKRVFNPKETKWVPYSARYFLERLGLDAGKVAKIGFGGVEKQIIELSQNPETGLSTVERGIARGRLKGKSQKELGDLYRMSEPNVAVIEKRIAKKLRWQIKKREYKTASR